MTTNQKNSRYFSFLVRLWQEDEVETSATWRGEIESIQTGQRWQFADLESLFDFMRARIAGESASDSAKDVADRKDRRE